MTRRSTHRLALALVLVAALLGCGSDDGASSPPGTPSGPSDPATSSPEAATITTTLLEGALFQLAHYVAEDQGFYAEQNLTIETVPIGSGPDGATALATGAVDIVTNTPEFIILANQQGLDQRIVASNLVRGITALVTRAGIDRDTTSDTYPGNLADLADLTIGITARGSSAEFIVKRIAEDAGIDPDSLTFVATGGVGPSIAALEAGQIDAWNAFEPGLSTCVHELELCEVMVDLRAGDGPEDVVESHVNVIATTQSYIEEHPDRVERYVVAIGTAMEWIKDPANREDLKGIMTRDLSATEAIIDHLIDDNLDTFGIEMDPAKYANAVSLLESSGLLEEALPFEDVVTQFGLEQLGR